MKCESILLRETKTFFMKKAFTLLVLFSLFAWGCSNSDDPTKDPEQEETENENKEENLIDISKDLCDGKRFIDREYKDFSSPELGVYKAVMTQREYLFEKGGSGKLTTYVADNKYIGYSQGVTDFTWTATDKSPVSLKISLSDGEKIVLNDVEIKDNELSSSEDIWTREICLKSAWSSSDITSYSVDMSTIDTTYPEPPYMICLKVSPSRLSVKTEAGEVTFISLQSGYNPTLIGMQCFSKDNGPLQYYGSYIYACVDVKNPYYPYSFFDIIAEKGQMPFQKDGKMYFYLGKFDKDTHKFSLIESNKDYNVN